MASSSPSTLPPLVETFPADKYPLREIGQGFTAQACQGEEAQSCALIAAEMLDESRTIAVSSVSSENNAGAGGLEGFTVSDLPLPEGVAQVSAVDPGCYHCCLSRLEISGFENQSAPLCVWSVYLPGKIMPNTPCLPDAYHNLSLSLCRCACHLPTIAVGQLKQHLRGVHLE